MIQISHNIQPTKEKTRKSYFNFFFVRSLDSLAFFLAHRKYHEGCYFSSITAPICPFHQVFESHFGCKRFQCGMEAPHAYVRCDCLQLLSNAVEVEVVFSNSVDRTRRTSKKHALFSLPLSSRQVSRSYSEW